VTGPSQGLCSHRTTKHKNEDIGILPCFSEIQTLYLSDQSPLYIVTYTHKIQSSVQRHGSWWKSPFYDVYKHQVTKLVQQDAEILIQHQFSNCADDTPIVGPQPFLNSETSFCSQCIYVLRMIQNIYCDYFPKRN
jgi:hypothetical protein